MNLKDYRRIFVVIGASLVLVANIPLIGMVFPITRGGGMQSFSELYELGTNQLIAGYPFNTKVGKSETFFIGVHNHLGYLAYYDVQMKFVNSTQPLPYKGEPSSSPTLREFHILLENNEEWETKIDFTVLKASSSKGRSSVNLISVNGATFNVGCSSNWDSKYKGFYYRLFFELWLYNTTSRRFEYHGRFVSLTLNMTA